MPIPVFFGAELEKNHHYSDLLNRMNRFQIFILIALALSPVHGFAEELDIPTDFNTPVQNIWSDTQCGNPVLRPSTPSAPTAHPTILPAQVAYAFTNGCVFWNFPGDQSSLKALNREMNPKLQTQSDIEDWLNWVSKTFVGNNKANQWLEDATRREVDSEVDLLLNTPLAKKVSIMSDILTSIKRDYLNALALDDFDEADRIRHEMAGLAQIWNALDLFFASSAIQSVEGLMRFAKTNSHSPMGIGITVLLSTYELLKAIHNDSTAYQAARLGQGTYMAKPIIKWMLNKPRPDGAQFFAGINVYYNQVQKDGSLLGPLNNLKKDHLALDLEFNIPLPIRRKSHPNPIASDPAPQFPSLERVVDPGKTLGVRITHSIDTNTLNQTVRRVSIETTPDSEFLRIIRSKERSSGLSLAECYNLIRVCESIYRSNPDMVWLDEKSDNRTSATPAPLYAQMSMTVAACRQEQLKKALSH